jgi:hypothetical protein
MAYLVLGPAKAPTILADTREISPQLDGLSAPLPIGRHKNQCFCETRNRSWLVDFFVLILYVPEIKRAWWD